MVQTRYGNIVYYAANVAYEYTVSGTEYNCDRVSRKRDNRLTKFEAEQIAELYPSDNIVNVSYDPGDPSIAVLEPGAARVGIWPLCIGIIVVGVGLLLAGSAVYEVVTHALLRRRLNKARTHQDSDRK